MNKLDTLFQQKQKNILSIYFTAGYPKQEDTNVVIKSLENSGVDMLEIGIPFSDPVADGPTIQQSNTVAIENGITLQVIFNQLRKIKETSKIPKILMGYFNPVLQFGVEEFCNECKEVGVDGVIIPDLPLYEYEEKYKNFFESNGIHFIFLVTPQTSDERLQQIEKLSSSFIYAVSTNATTGVGANFLLHESYFTRLSKTLKRPFLIGFGIKDKDTFDKACKYANGAIVGSAFIQALAGEGNLKNKIEEFGISLS